MCWSILTLIKSNIWWSTQVGGSTLMLTLVKILKRCWWQRFTSFGDPKNVGEDQKKLQFQISIGQKPTISFSIQNGFWLKLHFCWWQFNKSTRPPPSYVCCNPQKKTDSYTIVMFTVRGRIPVPVRCRRSSKPCGWFPPPRSRTPAGHWGFSVETVPGEWGFKYIKTQR